MKDENKSWRSGIGSIKLFIITAVVIIFLWIIGKGALMLISSAKQM